MEESVEVLIAQAERSRLNLYAIRCGVSDIFNPETGLLLHSPSMGWSNVDLKALMHSETCSALLSFSNATNLAALAEARLRRESSTTNCQDFLYISGSTGLGAAWVRGGTVDPGPHGWAGEIGHLPIADESLACSCGSNGCLEAAAGIHSILNATGIGDNAPFGLLLAKLHKGDKVATRIVSRAGRLLGKALAIYCNLVDAPAIVLGGQYRLLVPYMSESISTQLKAHTLNYEWRPVSLETSLLGDEATSVGAAQACISEFLQEPDRWLIPSGGWQKQVQIGAIVPAELKEEF